MKKFNKKTSLLIFLFLITISLLTFVGIEEYNLNNPKHQKALLKTLPVDPRDLLSGNYFILNYEISNPNNFTNYSPHIYQNEITVYAILEKNNKHFIPKYLSLQKPKSLNNNEIAIKGKFSNRRIKYGIEKYFINENQKEPNRSDNTEVLVTISKSHKARIYKIFVNDEEYK